MEDGRGLMILVPRHPLREILDSGCWISAEGYCDARILDTNSVVIATVDTQMSAIQK